MKLAATGNFEGIGVRRVLHTQRNVRIQLAVETVTDVAGGDVFAFLSGKRAVVDTEVHGDRGLRNLLEGDRVRRVHRADRITDFQVVDSAQGDDRTHGRLADVLLLQSVKLVEFGDADFLPFGGIMMVDQQRVLVDADASAVDLADSDPSHIFIVIDG